MTLSSLSQISVNLFSFYISALFCLPKRHLNKQDKLTLWDAIIISILLVKNKTTSGCWLDEIITSRHNTKWWKLIDARKFSTIFCLSAAIRKSYLLDKSYSSNLFFKQKKLLHWFSNLWFELRLDSFLKKRSNCSFFIFAKSIHFCSV